MDIPALKEKILTDQGFVIAELKQFLTYYNLKHTLRWGMGEKDDKEKESVSDHVFGMHILADYFLPLYQDLDQNQVKSLITWHDMAEAVVGDMTTKTKTTEHRQAESEAETRLVENAGNLIQPMLNNCFGEYEEQKTIESRFVKAIDKVEPIFHMYFLSQTTDVNKNIFKTKDSGWTMKDYTDHRKPYIQPFPEIWQYDRIMTPIIDKAGFFREWA